MKKVLLGIGIGLVAVILVAAGAIYLSPARTVLASAVTGNAPWQGGGGWQAGGAGFSIPPELQGMMSIPANQRFSHFEGAQVNLKDKDNHPLTISVTPGKVTSASATSLAIAANDGSNQTFTLNDKTIIHGMGTPAPTGTPSAPSVSSQLQPGDDVVVVTLNKSSTATAVIAGGPNGFSMPGHGGWGPHGQGQ